MTDLILFVSQPPPPGGQDARAEMRCCHRKTHSDPRQPHRRERTRRRPGARSEWRCGTTDLILFVSQPSPSGGRGGAATPRRDGGYAFAGDTSLLSTLDRYRPAADEFLDPTGLLLSGQIRFRKIDGWQKLEDVIANSKKGDLMLEAS